jgi:YesN/AraC family two-component response regulator
MPYLDGLQMVSLIKKLELKNEFKLVMISAEDYDYSIINNIVDEFLVKPINASKFKQIYMDY